MADAVCDDPQKVSGQFLSEADINQDRSVNLLDVAGFVELLSGN